MQIKLAYNHSDQELIFNYKGYKVSFCKSEGGIFLQLFVLLDFTRTSFGGSVKSVSAGGRVKNVLYIIMTVT